MQNALSGLLSDGLVMVDPHCRPPGRARPVDLPRPGALLRLQAHSPRWGDRWLSPRASTLWMRLPIARP